MLDRIRNILKEYWGYPSFRPLQEEIILSVLDGQDTLALMPTGGGKSITYQVPALASEGLCVVVTPLIALMKDQVEELGRRDIPAAAVYTGMEPKWVESALNRCIAGKVKFLYVSPERLGSEAFRLRLKRMKVSLLAVDEAHCISQWGYDFRPSYLKIAEIRDFFPGVPVLALTATATPRVVEDIQRRLGFSAPHVLSKSFRRGNISYVVRKADDRLGELLHILSSLEGTAIVYVRRRATAEDVAAFLRRKGIVAACYHAGLTAARREERQQDWKEGRCPVIVATNAFGMGIDKADVRLVIHFDIPDSPEAYFQEAGRAGRDGRRAYAVLLYNEASLTALKKRVALAFPPKEHIRKVYSMLGSFLSVEEGEGEGRAYAFDPDLFVKNFRLEYVPMLSSLEILQVAGYLECTKEVRSRSCISFLVLRDQLRRIRFAAGLEERLVEHLLRSFPGIFVQYVSLDEEELARELSSSREEVYRTLLALSARKLVSYIPGNDRPYIVYHQPRVPENYLRIGREAYEDRRGAYADKVEHMAAYITEERRCRQLLLMEYFGQREEKDCGVCDNCLAARKKRETGPALDRRILALLEESDLGVQELVRSLGGSRELAVERIRHLLESGKICYRTSTVLGLSRN